MGRAIYVDSLIPAAESINPDCGRRPVVLKRPPCMFAPSEFYWLRLRAPYVVLVCGERTAFGMPLASLTSGSRVE